MNCEYSTSTRSADRRKPKGFPFKRLPFHHGNGSDQKYRLLHARHRSPITRNPCDTTQILLLKSLSVKELVLIVKS